MRSAETCGGSHNTPVTGAGPEAGGLLALDAASAWRGRGRWIGRDTRGPRSYPDLSHAAHGLCRYGDTCVDMSRYGDRYLCVDNVDILPSCACDIS